MTKKRYVFVGSSFRGLGMFAQPIVTELQDYAEIAGVYDINIDRANVFAKECGNINVYNDFDKMLTETKPDAVIVTTIDRYHHEYIVKALEAGCDAITEKPMTIDAEKTKTILDAEKRTGKKVIVTFNVRYVPYVTRIKEILMSGVIGEVTNVHLEWNLDLIHGADYFRRWHRYMKNSGGLLVHKSTHHFDMINWWLDDNPEEVYAYGSRRFYGPTRDKKGERCLTCEHKDTCEFYWDITKSEVTRKLYLETENNDGYHRDRCVFADDIDIYDSMSLNVKYLRGTMLNYSLVAYSPYEGWKCSITGTKGRIEAEDFTSGQRSKQATEQIRVYNHNGDEIVYNINKATGGHGGGDERLRRMLFVGDIEDTLGHQADSMAGAMAVLIGAGANISIKQGKSVNIKDMLQ